MIQKNIQCIRTVQTNNIYNKEEKTQYILTLEVCLCFSVTVVMVTPSAEYFLHCLARNKSINMLLY